MQVSPASVAPSTRQTDYTRSDLLPEIFSLTELGTQTQTLRKLDNQRVERETQLERRKAAGLDKGVHDNTSALKQAERDLAPGSRAFRRQQLSEAQQRQLAEREGGFKQALRDAGRGTQQNAADRSHAVDAGRRSVAGNAPADQTSAKTPSSPGEKDGKTPPGATHASNTHTNRSDVRQSASEPAPAGRENTPAVPNFAAVRHAGSDTSGKMANASTSRIAENARSSSVQSIARGAPGSAPRGGSTSGQPVATGSPASESRTAEARPAQRSSANAETKAAERNSDLNNERILRYVRTNLSRERSQAWIRLDPPELGSVRLHMDLRKDILTLRIDTENNAAHRLLRDQLDHLRQGLETAGIRLERVDVRPPAPADASPESQSQQTAGDEPNFSESSEHADSDAQPSPKDRTDDQQPGSSQEVTTDEQPVRQKAPEPALESLVNVIA